VPQLFGLILTLLPILRGFFIVTILPAAGPLLKFLLSRSSRIPTYLQLLWTIYGDSEPNSEARKYLTSVLLVLSSILTFVTYSYVPMTAVPVVGAFTTPIAALIAMTVSLAALDILFSLNQDYLAQRYPEAYVELRADVDALSTAVGRSHWDVVIQQTQWLLDSVKSKVDPDQNYDNTLLASINALTAYLRNPEQDDSLSPDEINQRLVTEALPPMAKMGGSMAEGLVAGAATGLGASGVASSLFAPATMLTSVKAALGLTGGSAIVSASAYTALTVAAPIGLALVAGAGACFGASALRTKGEKDKLSRFLADVLIAALPVAWVDDKLCDDERDVLEKLLLNGAIAEVEQQRVRQAMADAITFDQVLQQGLLKAHNPHKQQMKHRLILCTAYELAKANGLIGLEEVSLHDRMAKVMGFSPAEVSEVRRLTLLKSGVNLRDRIQVCLGNLCEQQVDAIVNSTNPNFLPMKRPLGWFKRSQSEALDQAIHRSAGPALQVACKALAQGEGANLAQVTPGFELPAEWIIHTIAPVWNTRSDATAQLERCYRQSLELAQQEQLITIAFPALGTSQGCFPVGQASQIAVREIHQFLSRNLMTEEVRIVCQDEATLKVYQQAVNQELGEPGEFVSVVTKPGEESPEAALATATTC